MKLTDKELKILRESDGDIFSIDIIINCMAYARLKELDSEYYEDLKSIRKLNEN